MGKKINDGLSKWQRYRLRLKEKGIVNGHNKSMNRNDMTLEEIEHDKKRKKEYRRTKRGRALTLISGYKTSDKKHNRGDCTLTAEWIIDNIFSGQHCHYCNEESNWLKLGCDRIDNALPHTPDNCVPCCKHCNEMKGVISYDDFMKKLGLVN